jgi:L-serine dehydratase
MTEKLFYPDFFNDVFGPIMQPGSSGGFAGTDRIGRVARHALKSEPKRARILFNPSEKRLVSLGTWMEDRAYLGGIMDFDTEDERLFQAHELARGQGLSYEFGELDRDNGIPHSTTFLVEGEGGDQAKVIASSIGGGMIRVYEIHDFKVNWQADTYALLLWKTDGEKVSDEVLKRTEELLGDELVATNKVEDTAGKTGILIESAKEAGEEIISFLEQEGLEYRRLPLLLPVATTLRRKQQLFTSVEEWREVAKERGISFVQAAIEYEKNFSGWSDRQIWDYFERIASILDAQIHSLERLGCENVEDTPMLPIYGKNWEQYEKKNRVLSDKLTRHIIVHALATNAKVPGVKIVPGPMGTGGGYLFSALDAVREERGFSHEKLIEGLIVAAGFGVIAFTRSNPSGERGCVGESGVCSAMAAAAVAWMAGSCDKAAENAASMALQASFGITCDAIPGGLEFPCITRTVRAAVNAPLYADLALSGIDPLIPYHEVVDAMELHYKRSDKRLLCGSECGLNCTPTADKCKQFIAGDVMKDFLKYDAQADGKRV